MNHSHDKLVTKLCAEQDGGWMQGTLSYLSYRFSVFKALTLFLKGKKVIKQKNLKCSVT